MSTKDVVFVRQQGGLARTAPGEDHISAFISYGGLGSIPDSVVEQSNGTYIVNRNTELVTPIFSLKQFEDLGISQNDLTVDSVPVVASYDTDGETSENVVLEHYIHNVWYYHVSEFFRINPTGVLWLGLFENKNIGGTDVIDNNNLALSAGLTFATALLNLKKDIVTGKSALETAIIELAKDPENTDLKTDVTNKESDLAEAESALEKAMEKANTAFETAKSTDDISVVSDGVALFDKEIKQVQLAADGRIRQAAVYTTDNLTSGALGTLQGTAESLEADHMPLSILYAANIAPIDLNDDGDTLDPDEIYDVTTTSIKSGSNKNVSVVIGQDGGNTGKNLFDENRHSITCLGATLGTVSSASVHESIAWVQEFDVSSSELNTIALADGRPISTIPKSQQTIIDNNGYIFLKKHIGISGSYFNDSHTATLPTSDYAFIENNRTLDKAIRGIRTALLPQLNSPLYVEDNGNLSFDTVGYFESLASRSLEAMRIDGEVSNYDVFIDSSQNVLSTSELKIQVSIIPVGVARTIEVSIGFTLSIA